MSQPGRGPADNTHADLDCLKCGACCVAHNPAAAGWAGPLSIEERATLPCAIVMGPNGPLIATVGAPLNACVGLQGQVGQSVRCAIYELRPASCRALPRGDPLCLFFRARMGIEGEAS